MSKKERADFMTPFQKSLMGKTPRTHANCKALTGVSRPCKTAKDRAMRLQSKS